MKSRLKAIIILSLLILCGCTQYNGYIGPIFGSWSLVELTEDGIPMQLYGETVFSFQNELVRVIRFNEDPYVTHTKYGNFTVTDELLTLKFQDSPNTEGDMYMTPDWLHFPLNGDPIVFDIKKLNGSEMILHLDSGGKILVYSFKKTW